MTAPAVIAVALYWVVFACAWILVVQSPQRAGPAGSRSTAAESIAFRPTPWGIGVFLAVTIPSVVQLFVPGMLEAGRRQVGELANGDYHRLLTSMVLQDGGPWGTVFNLAALAVTVTVVARVLPGPGLLIVFVLGGVLGNLLNLFIWPSDGAGSSMATMFLAVFAALLVPPRWAKEYLVPLLVLVAAALGLLVLGDRHGLAVAPALILGAPLCWWTARNSVRHEE